MSVTVSKKIDSTTALDLQQHLRPLSEDSTVGDENNHLHLSEKDPLSCGDRALNVP